MFEDGVLYSGGSEVEWVMPSRDDNVWGEEDIDAFMEAHSAEDWNGGGVNE